MRNRLAAILAAAALALPALAADPPGGPAPQFTLAARSGANVSLAQYKGQVVMLNFGASWCGPCRQEMPLLESIYKQYHRMGFTLIGVNVEPDSNAANQWLKETPVSFPILYDKESNVSQMYDVAGMPSTVIIDRAGKVRVLHRGYKPGDENGYLDSVRTLVREERDADDAGTAGAAAREPTQLAAPRARAARGIGARRARRLQPAAGVGEALRARAPGRSHHGAAPQLDRGDLPGPRVRDPRGLARSHRGGGRRLRMQLAGAASRGGARKTPGNPPPAPRGGGVAKL